MLDIYVCEDNKIQLELISKYVSNTILIEQLDMQLACASTTSGKILEQAKKSENTGVFFLDICLQSEMTGLILAQELRKIQPRCFIIFITSHSEMSILTFQYKVEALDFIIKDSSENIRKRIHECLMDINKKILTVNKKQQKSILITQNDRLIAVDYDEVLFFETSENNHKIILHAKKRVVEFTGHLKSVEVQLDYRFYRCHRSYIVNTDNIREVNFQKLTIYMENGEICPISVRAKTGFKKYYNEHLISIGNTVTRISKKCNNE